MMTIPTVKSPQGLYLWTVHALRVEPDLFILALFERELVAAPEVRPELAVPHETVRAIGLH